MHLYLDRFFEDVMVVFAPCFRAIHIPKGYGDKQWWWTLVCRFVVTTLYSYQSCSQMVTSGHSLDETRERVWPTSESWKVHYGWILAEDVNGWGWGCILMCRSGRKDCGVGAIDWGSGGLLRFDLLKIFKWRKCGANEPWPGWYPTCDANRISFLPGCLDQRCDEYGFLKSHQGSSQYSGLKIGVFLK